MNRMRMWQIIDFPASLSESILQISFITVNKIALVQQANLIEGGTSQHQAG
jgi:hypothetical protein